MRTFAEPGTTSARAPLEVLERRLVRGDEAGSRAPLDRHVADRQAAFHRELADRRAGVLDDVADAAVDPELADRAEDQVLRRQPGVKLALELDEHRLRSPLRQRLGREHVLDLRRADAEGECPESAVRRGVRVAADDRETRLREAELRADDVYDSLAAGAGRVQL